MLSARLHRQQLVFWPNMIAEMRRQRLLLRESAGVSTPPEDDWLIGLKVLFHTGRTHSGSHFVRVSDLHTFHMHHEHCHV